MKKMKKNRISWLLFLLVGVFSSCSTTVNLPENEILYTGIEKIKIEHEDQGEHALEAKTEMLAALEAAPNGSFMGSSTIKSPFPIGLWVWNAFVNDQEEGIGKWAFNAFAKQPVLISSVNPTLRARMASNALQNFGYFRSSVKSEIISDKKNPKKAKVSYAVDMHQPYYLDSITYVGFHPTMMELIEKTKAESFLRTGDAFSVINLDAERNRLNRLFQNEGYFYTKNEFMTYKADTVARPWHVQLRMEPIATADIPRRALRTWTIGNVDINLKESSSNRRLRDTLKNKYITAHYRGKKSPLRIGSLMRAVRFRPDSLYTLNNFELTQQRMSQLGVFSSVEYSFTPRDTTNTCRILDVLVDATLDKPISSELEADMRTKSNGQVGPELSFSVSKKNVFHGGETFSISANGSYEWQTQRTAGESSSKVNSYELGLTASLEFPRLMFPGQMKTRSQHQRSTTLKMGVNELHRAGFFDILSFTDEATYNWQSTRTERLSFSPLHLTYSKLRSKTERFDSIMNKNKFLYLSMDDQFIPAMNLTYTYDDKVRQRRVHTWWQASITEGGNLVSGAYMLAGKEWGQKGKKLLNNPYAQFVKLTAEMHKAYKVGEKSVLATRVMGGAIFTYGNSIVAPYSEQFYCGGANSIRAYTVRGIGPGGHRGLDTSFLDQTGDIKFEANVEYRFNIAGSFNGAIFLDTGNVWLMREDEDRPDSKFNLKDCWNQIAVGTGLGLRYDMEFLVLRLDMGIPVHNPYKTGNSGYFNREKIKDCMSLHFAVGYPF